MDETITKTLDLKGLSCPLPIAKTAQAIRDLQPGELIESLATDPGAVPGTSTPGAPRRATSWSSRARRAGSTAS